ncbi:MAG TPA: RidA family protein [Stellaceae bacterium]|nr:RidA family protein [Stellaceae bacterium]
MDILRSPGSAPGRSQGTAFGQLVWAVATDRMASATIEEQTRRTLSELDRVLMELGSDRTRILSATVYLARMSDKPRMDAAWVEWIGSDRSHWPQRACVGAALEGKTLVEIVLVAAKI